MENKTKLSIKNTKDKKFAYKVPFVVIYIPAKIMGKTTHWPIRLTSHVICF